jgi:pimeloyl-ACP methyl ester carboxylesterase
VSTRPGGIPSGDAGTSTAARVLSCDGTEIAYRTSGDGPPLLLVHGTAGARERFAPLLPYLEPCATVHAMDRRGRGASGAARTIT